MMFAGKYVLEEKIGEGAMGVVYRARHAQLDIDLAIKVLHDDYANDETFRARFLREARVAHAFVHKHAVMLRDFGVTDDNRPYLTMDLCPGRPLSEILDDLERLPPQRAIRIAMQVADVLADAHAAGILHRDIKPDNIMVDDSTGDDQVKVMDFGIAKMMAGDISEADLTRGNAIGTPLYMSPEQAAGEAMDGRSDIYSLGIVLYQCLAGNPPFRANSVQALLMKHLTQPPPPLPPDVEDRTLLDPLVMKALAKDPEDRYASATEMLRAFRAFLDHDTAALDAVLGDKGSIPSHVQAPRRKVLSGGPENISVSPQAEQADSAEFDSLPRPLARIRPIDETQHTGDSSGSIPPLVKRISPARESEARLEAGSNDGPTRNQHFVDTNGRGDQDWFATWSVEDADQEAVERTVVSTHGPGPENLSPIPPRDHAKENSSLDLSTETPSDYEYAQTVVSDSMPGMNEPVSSDPPEPTETGSVPPLSQCDEADQGKRDLIASPELVTGQGDDTALAPRDEEDDQDIPVAPRHTWRRRLLAATLLVLLLAGTTVALAKWAVSGLLPGMLQHYLDANPELAITLDNLASLGFLFGERTDEDKGTEAEPQADGAAAPQASEVRPVSSTRTHRPKPAQSAVHQSADKKRSNTPPKPAVTPRTRVATSHVTAGSSARAKHTTRNRGFDSGKQVDIDLDSGQREVFVTDGDLVLTGSFASTVDRVEVQGRRVRSVSGHFHAPLHLAEGHNSVAVIGYTGASSETRLIDIVVDTQPPRLTIDRPDNGIYLMRLRVPVAGSVEDENLDTVTINGQRARVHDGRFLGVAELKPGKNVIEIVATDKAHHRTVRHVTVYHSRRSPTPP